MAEGKVQEATVRGRPALDAASLLRVAVHVKAIADAVAVDARTLPTRSVAAFVVFAKVVDTTLLVSHAACASVACLVALTHVRAGVAHRGGGHAALVEAIPLPTVAVVTLGTVE